MNAVTSLDWETPIHAVKVPNLAQAANLEQPFYMIFAQRLHCI